MTWLAVELLEMLKRDPPINERFNRPIASAR
jgi:hypothetical protein